MFQKFLRIQNIFQISVDIIYSIYIIEYITKREIIMNQTVQFLLKITPEENEMFQEIVDYYHFKTKTELLRYYIRNTHDKIHGTQYYKMEDKKWKS